MKPSTVVSGWDSEDGVRGWLDLNTQIFKLVKFEKSLVIHRRMFISQIAVDSLYLLLIK